MTRYDFATLARVMGMSEPEAVTALNIDAKSAILYRRDGMSELVADRVAVRAGFVPYDVWDGWFEHAEGDRRASVAARKRKWRRRARAATRHRERERNRVYYRENRDYLLKAGARYKAAHAEQIKAQNAAYREANRERIRLRQRAYYHANRDRLIAAQRARDLERRHPKNKDNVTATSIGKKSEIHADKCIDYKATSTSTP